MRVLICYALLLASVLIGFIAGVLTYGACDLFVMFMVGEAESAMNHPIMVRIFYRVTIPIGCFIAVGVFGWFMVELASEAAQDEARQYTNAQIDEFGSR